MKRIQQIWTPRPSGVLEPTGLVTDNFTRSKTNYLDISARAKEIETLYTEDGVHIAPNSGLGKLIRNAKELWERWFLNQTNALTSEMFFLGLHLDRIAEAILPLKDEKDRPKYLRKLLSGTLDFFKRKQSKAKSILWELEVWSRLRRKTSGVFLREPPDVVVNFEDSQIGIACKKIYSERHVQNVLSQAVGQIESNFEFGIAAINIDDLLPANVVLNLESSAAVSDRLCQFNGEFLKKHDRHFRKYLTGGRLISAIVSTSVISDVPMEKPRFNNVWQWTVWTIPGLPERHQNQLKRFYDIVMA